MSEPGTRLCGGDGGQGLANRPFERTPQVSMALSNLPISHWVSSTGWSL